MSSEVGSAACAGSASAFDFFPFVGARDFLGGAFGLRDGLAFESIASTSGVSPLDSSGGLRVCCSWINAASAAAASACCC